MSGILSMLSGGTYSSAPANTVAPVVSGTATVGQTLSTTNGTWTGAPDPTFTYQWQRAESNIGGATSSTYVLVSADVGNAIRCVVTGTNAVSAVSANSNATGSVAAVVPGAPTSVSASATAPTTASVTFSAPADNGGAAITTYTVSGGGSGSGASSPISVTGLSGGTSYTFTVTATNSAGTGPSGSAGAITTPEAPPNVIGQAYGGGYYAGSISTAGNGTASHYLIVGPLASAQSTLQQKDANTSTAGTTSVIDGPTNSGNMNNANHPAAQFCEGLTVGSQTDWYMPAKLEVELCYYNLKPGTTANSNSGRNANAVPARPNVYQAGDPAQTSATAFQTGNSEAFTAADYWSSSQGPSPRAWIQNFDNGYQGYSYKVNSRRVRAVRRVAV